MSELGPAAMYDLIVIRLRARRRSPGWEAEQDREDLATLADLHERLAPKEKKRADAEGWKSWPHLFDERMEKAGADLVFSHGHLVTVVKARNEAQAELEQLRSWVRAYIAELRARHASLLTGADGYAYGEVAGELEEMLGNLVRREVLEG